MHAGRLSLVSILVFCATWRAHTADAENWPQWRGPNLNGTSAAKGLPLKWSESENVRWKVEIPSWSGATPVIWGERIFVVSPTAPRGDDRAETVKSMAGPRLPDGTGLMLLCLSKEDGSRLWERELGRGNEHWGKQNMASPSPVTDGKHVWTLTGTGILTTFDVEGEVVWRKDLQKEYGQFGLNWGYASSPLLFDGKLIVEVLHGMTTDEPSYLVAFDPASGDEIWKVDRPTDAQKESPDAYSTPIPLHYADRTEIVISGGDVLTGHDPKTGREIWRCAGLNPKNDDWWRTVCSPLAIDGMVFCSAKMGPLVAVRAGGEGDVSKTHLAWTSELACDVPTPVSDGKYLYILNDRGRFSCLDPKSGEPLYAGKELPRGTYSASPLLAEGRIYVTSESCTTAVLAAGPQFKVLSTNELDDRYTLSSLAVSGRELFIRTSANLYCISEGN